jgi:uncharacterized protein
MNMAGEEKTGIDLRGLPAGWRTRRKIDAHAHLTGQEGSYTLEAVLEAADRLGIGQLCCSCLTGGRPKCNDLVIEAMKRKPERILGYCYVVPGEDGVLAEIDRCLDAGMVGIKLLNQVKLSDPKLWPIAEKAVERSVPIMAHAGRITDAGSRASQPEASDASDARRLAEKFPALMLIHAHIGGGGDWEWTIKELRESPGIFLDTGGGLHDDKQIEAAVAELGAQRLLFATDMSMEVGVGKIVDAELSEEDCEAIFWKNMQGILDRRRR